nr:tRNA (adenosine(37)-N6)-threonylcarbamoyltransferase complex ATPase subunit type 1 TsaE [Psychromicrobium silvestre]
MLRAGDLVILSGELGAGKTTFTQSLGAALGVRPGIISPTFVLVRIHPSLVEGPDLVHVDAYRLASAGEIDDIDLENTMDTAVTVVEWGEDRVEHLSDSYLLIRLERPALAPGSDSNLGPDSEEDSEPRTIELTAVGPRWAGLDLEAIRLRNENPLG